MSDQTLGRGVWVDPMREFRHLQEELNRRFAALRPAEAGQFPPANVWTGEAGIVVTVEIPGVAAKALEIAVHRNTLTLKGAREAEETGADNVSHRRERRHGAFGRTITLPFNVDADKVEAAFNDGILTVRLPRPEAEKPRRISISTS